MVKLFVVAHKPSMIPKSEVLVPVNDSTMGYRVKGYYADDEMGEWTHTKMEDG